MHNSREMCSDAFWRRDKFVADRRPSGGRLYHC